MTPTTTSPTGRRHHLRSQSEDGQMTSEYILTPNTALTKLARARKGWIFAQARSAPTSPAGTLRGWGTPIKNGFQSLRIAENGGVTDSEEVGSEMASEEQLQDEYGVKDGEGGFSTDAVDYPTPMSAIEESD